MKIYIESISEELKQKVKGFLREHNATLVDYRTWREALNLHKEVSDEIMKNDEEYRKEYQTIIDYYHENHKDDELNAYEIQLMNETNQKLKSLDVRYIHNEEINDLLNQLLEKRYK